MRAFSLVPAVAMFAGFAVLGLDAYLVGQRRHRFWSRRGLGLALLGVVLLFLPIAFVLPLFGPAHRVVRLDGFRGARGAVVLVEAEALLPPWMGNNAVYRLTVLDPHDGLRLGRAAFEAGTPGGLTANVRRVATTDDKLWYVTTSDGLHARDPYTGRVSMGRKDLLRTYPQLERQAAGEIATGDGYVFRTHPGVATLDLVKTPPRTMDDAEPTRLALTADPDGTLRAPDGRALSGPGGTSADGGRVVAAMHEPDGPLVAVDGAAPRLERRTIDGAVRWSAPLPAPVGPALVLGGRVFVGAGRDVVALDGATGAQLFRVRP